jgi:hypothetical protein
MSEPQKLQESENDSCNDELEKAQGELDDGDATHDPRRWPNTLRQRATACVGILAFLEPFASAMIAPSLETIAEEFGVTSSVERNVSDKMLQLDSD